MSPSDRYEIKKLNWVRKFLIDISELNANANEAEFRLKEKFKHLLKDY